jgi:hypothetical protein
MNDFNNINAAGVTTEGTYTPDKLNDRDTVTRVRTIAAGGGVLPRGALLGKITATGKYILSLAAAADGSQVPDAVLLEPVDATAADVPGAVALAGKFSQQGVTFGAGQTVANTEAALRDEGHLPRQLHRLIGPVGSKVKWLTCLTPTFSTASSTSASTTRIGSWKPSSRSC